MKKFVIAGLLGLLGLCCQQNVRGQDSPQTLLKKAVRAVGGEQALRAIRATEARGQITRASDGATGGYRSVAAAPNFYALKFDLRGEATAAGFNGKSAWTEDSRDGLRTLTGAAGLAFENEAQFRNQGLLAYKNKKTKISADAQSSFAGANVKTVALTTEDGITRRIFLDAATFLPRGEETNFNGSSQTIECDDYQTTNEIAAPRRLTLTKDGEKYLIQLTEVSYNATLAKSEFDFPRSAEQPDIAALFREVLANEERVDEILESYTWLQTEFKRTVDKNGARRDAETAKRRVSYYKGYEIDRLEAKNGQPLSAGGQRQEDQRILKRVAEIDKKAVKNQADRTVKQTSSGTPDDEGQRISIAELLKASNFVNPRREQFRGRETIVFDFEPNPQFDYKTAKSFLKFFGKTAGTVWIDQADLQVVRVEAYLADDFKVAGGLLVKIKKGGAFALEQERIGGEVWLPSVVDITLSIRALLVKGISVNQIIKSSDYRKVNVEVKDLPNDRAVKPD